MLPRAPPYETLTAQNTRVFRVGFGGLRLGHDLVQSVCSPLRQISSCMAQRVRCKDGLLNTVLGCLEAYMEGSEFKVIKKTIAQYSIYTDRTHITPTYTLLSCSFHFLFRYPYISPMYISSCAAASFRAPSSLLY